MLRLSTPSRHNRATWEQQDRLAVEDLRVTTYRVGRICVLNKVSLETCHESFNERRKFARLFNRHFMITVQQSNARFLKWSRYD
jgi:hypothetical protein